MVSPDGRFVAYVSNESGTFEVYVRSFRANTGGKWRVTQTGGYQPRWGRDGKELFFFTADGRLMSAIFGGGAALTNHYWDVSADGQRFLINTASPSTASSMLTVVLNWPNGLPAVSR